MSVDVIESNNPRFVPLTRNDAIEEYVYGKGIIDISEVLGNTLDNSVNYLNYILKTLINEKFINKDKIEDVNNLFLDFEEELENVIFSSYMDSKDDNLNNILNIFGAIKYMPPSGLVFIGKILINMASIKSKLVNNVPTVGGEVQTLLITKKGVKTITE